MRNGYKVYDSDTHVGPSADTLEKYLSSRVRELVPDLESRTVPQRRHSASIAYDSPYPTRFRLGSGGAVGGWGADVPRTLGEAEPRATTGGASGRFMGSKAPNLFSDDWDVDGRIRDKDEEGVDVQLLVNNGGPSGHENREVNVEFMRAQHRFLGDFCGKYPHRLKSMISTTASYIEESVAEIKRWSGSPWAVGVYVNLPVDHPLDHPDLHPIWQAVDEAGQCFIHHSFSQGYPGYRDLWHNPFLGRSASHPWGDAGDGRVLWRRSPGSLCQSPLCGAGVGIWLDPVLGRSNGGPGALHGLRGRRPAAYDAGVHDGRTLLRLDRPARG